MARYLSLLLVWCACGDGDDPALDAGTTTATDAGTDVGPTGCLEASSECTGGGACCDGLVCRASSGGREFCVTPDDTCFVGAATGCCLDDADCAGEARCHASECRHDGDGVCKDVPAEGECWSDRDCTAGATCSGAVMCPCGESCAEADAPGTCG